jgi:hypothetical protein
MNNHINSVARDKYHPYTTYELFVEKFGEETAKKLGLVPIPRKDVILKPDLFYRNRKVDHDG